MEAQNIITGSLNKISFKNLWSRVNKYMLIAAVVHFAFTFLTDGWIFTSEQFGFDVPLPLDGLSAKYYYIATKILAFICFFIIYQVISLFYRAFKTRNKKMIFDFILPFAIILGVYIINFIICYPGVYKIDDQSMFALATRYYPFYWHHYLTSLFYMVGMTVFPFASGQMILMDIFTAMIFAYIFYRTSSVLVDKNANKWKYLLLIVAFSPFVNTAMLESFRTYLYSILNMFFFAFLILEKIQKRRLTLPKFILLALGIAVLASWRSESMVYLIFAPFLLYTVYAGKIKIKAALLFTVAAAAVYWGVNLPQQAGNTKFYNNDYLIVSTTRPLSVLLNLEETYQYDGAQADVEKINAVINVDEIKRLPYNCISYQSWNTFINQGRLTETMSTKQAQSEYIKAFANIIFHNPSAFMKERLDLFIKTNYLGDAFQVDFGKELVRRGDPHLAPYWIFNNELISRNVLPAEMSNQTYWNAITFGWANGVYSVIPCLVLALIIIIFSIRYKAWLMFLIQLIVLAREFVVFMTSPSDAISYYMPTSVLSMFIGIMLLIFIIYNKKAKEKRKLFV